MKTKMGAFKISQIREFIHARFRGRQEYIATTVADVDAEFGQGAVAAVRADDARRWDRWAKSNRGLNEQPCMVQATWISMFSEQTAEGADWHAANCLTATDACAVVREIGSEQPADRLHIHC